MQDELHPLDRRFNRIPDLGHLAPGRGGMRLGNSMLVELCEALWGRLAKRAEEKDRARR
jgi:hypothetical protein